MKRHLAAALLFSQATVAQVSTNIGPNEIRTNTCANYGSFSSCLQNSANEQGINTKLTLESRIAGARLQSTFQETDQGLAARYELRNKYGSLQTNTLGGELETTHLLTRAKDWKIGLRYEHEQEDINATLQKDNLRIHYSDDAVRANYHLGNWRLQSSFEEKDYTANILFKLRF